MYENIGFGSIFGHKPAYIGYMLLAY